MTSVVHSKIITNNYDMYSRYINVLLTFCLSMWTTLDLLAT